MEPRLAPYASTKKILALIVFCCGLSVSYAQEIVPYELYTGKCEITHHSLKLEILFIDTEEKYLDLPFIEPMYGDPCDTVDYIDFTQKLLIGYGYGGSNCDKNPKLKIEKQGNMYQARFTVENPGACRDFSFERIWFIIDKPTEPFEFTMDRVRFLDEAGEK